MSVSAEPVVLVKVMSTCKDCPVFETIAFCLTEMPFDAEFEFHSTVWSAPVVDKLDTAPAIPIVLLSL
jgi:hypothetical protein